MKSPLLTPPLPLSELTLPELPVQEFDRKAAVKQCIEDYWNKQPGRIDQDFLAAVMNALGIQSVPKKACGEVKQPDETPQYQLYIFCNCDQLCGKVDFRFEQSKVTVTYAEGYK